MNYKTDINFRKETLIRLLNTIILRENEIIQALQDDFKKPAFETVLTETNYVISELKYTIKNLKQWTKPKRVLPFLLNLPSTDTLYSEPYGKVLIIAPWNYPFHFAFCPLISAVAAGNQVVLKPSEHTPNTSKIVNSIIQSVFHVQHVEVVEGGVEVSQQLLSQRWDYIFFTGSVSVGKIVAKAAAENLTPVTLELGGKNPCIIDQTANLKLAARRIVWGKFLNAGQTCIAPDYVVIHENMKSHFVANLKKEITKSFSENPENSADFARIINSKHWIRLVRLIDTQKVVFGGQTNSETNFIAPTLIEEYNLESAIMQEEIFGPLLPIITYKDYSEVKAIISKHEKPLSLYLFSENKKFWKTVIRDFSFGGGCINDTMVHFANKNLPFGGVGHSGMGAYHGKRSFDLFSHKKGIVQKANWLDFKFRYPPYTNKLQKIKTLLKLV